MYKIVERNYHFDWEELKEERFRQDWIDEEFWENREGQYVVYGTGDLKLVLNVYIDNGYAKPYVTGNDDGVNLVTYALYDDKNDEFLHIVNCEEYINNIMKK